jgi:hypothetical protein
VSSFPVGVPVIGSPGVVDIDGVPVRMLDVAETLVECDGFGDFDFECDGRGECDFDAEAVTELDAEADEDIDEDAVIELDGEALCDPYPLW